MIKTHAVFGREEKALRLLFQEVTGAVLAFGLYTERVVRQDVTEMLERQIALPVHVITLSPDFANPTIALASYPPVRQCFVFFETEAAFPEFLGYANFHREELIRSGHVLLFWIKEEGLRRIAEDAPDFWALRSRVFDFRTVGAFAPLTRARSDAVIGGYTATELSEQVSSLESTGSVDLVTQLALGRRLLALGRYGDAERSLQRVVDIAKKTNDQRSMAESLYLLGDTAFEQNQLNDAESLYRRSLAASQPYDSASTHLIAILRLTDIYLQQGNTLSAYTEMMQALPVARALGNAVFLVETYVKLGDVYYAKRDLRGAEQAYREAADYQQKLGYTSAQASTLNRLGVVYGAMGDTTRAQQALQRSAELFRQTGYTDEAEKVDDLLDKITVA